jgi:transcriptional regulator with XRE-family HTH domain
MVTGSDIKELRARFGDSQAAFAVRLGVTQPTIWRWEKNGVPADVRTQAFLREAISQCSSGAPT